MEVISTIAELRFARRALSGRVGLVPTMGALHEGHLALVRAARAENDTVVATIFVNPTQFEPGADLDKYPRDLPRDLDMLKHEGVDLVFTPSSGEIYPAGYQTTITVKEVSQGLEGARRPGHFEGVATVVAKLFNLTEPDVAYFGQKDAQQVVVIRRMVRDLNFPLEIAVCPTVRESDGLAMSSRNVYLDPVQRALAGHIPAAIQRAARAYEQGERDAGSLRHIVRDALAQPGLNLEYVSIADPGTLKEQEGRLESPALLSLTARAGTTRLLDNTLLPPALNTRAGLTATLGA